MKSRSPKRRRLKLLSTELPYSLRWISNGWRDYPVQYLQLVACVAVVMFAVYLLLPAIGNAGEASSDLLVAIVLAGLGLAALPRDRIAVLRNQYYGAATVDDRGVQLRYSSGPVLIPWSSITQALSGPRGVRLNGPVGLLFRIPARAFRSDSAARTFRDEVDRRASLARAKPEPADNAIPSGPAVGFTLRWTDFAIPWRRVAATVALLILAAWLALVGSGVISIAGLNLTDFVDSTPAHPVLYLVAAVLAVIVALQPLPRLYRTRRLIGRLAWVAAADDGLHVLQAGQSGTFAWDRISRVSANPASLRVFVGRVSVAILPERVLSSEPDGPAVRAALRQRIETARVAVDAWSRVTGVYGPLDFGDGPPVSESSRATDPSTPSVAPGISDLELLAAVRHRPAERFVIGAAAIGLSAAIALAFRQSVESLEFVGIGVWPLVSGLTGVLGLRLFRRREQERDMVLTWWFADIAGPIDRSIRSRELDSATDMAAGPGLSAFERARLQALVTLRIDERPDLDGLDRLAAGDRDPARASAAVEVVRALVAFRDGGDWRPALDAAYRWVGTHLPPSTASFLQRRRRRTGLGLGILSVISAGLLLFFFTNWPVDSWPLLNNSQLLGASAAQGIDVVVDGQHRQLSDDDSAQTKAVTILLEVLPAAKPYVGATPDHSGIPLWTWQPEGTVPDLPADAPIRRVAGVTLYLAAFFDAHQDIVGITYLGYPDERFYTLDPATMQRLADLLYPVAQPIPVSP